MATIPAILLSMLLPAAEPLTPAELDIAVAALEEVRTRLQSFEVTYRGRREAAPGGKNRAVEFDPEEYTIEWSWGEGREHFLITIGKFREEWWYDGKKTYFWQFNREDPAKLEGVSIHHWRDAGGVKYDLAAVTGFRGSHLEGGVLALAKAAVIRQTLSGEKTERGWELALGTHDINRAPFEISLILDPRHDYRLVSWQTEYRPKADEAPSLAHVHRYFVDEFQSVADEASGTSIWFPLRAHLEQSMFLIITRLEVDSIRINHDLPESRFTPPEMTFGTEVQEYTKPGELPKSYLVGGQAAQEQRLAALVEMAKKEQERLNREGVTFDATPRAASGAQVWMISGGILLLVGALLHWRRRRAA